MKCARAVPEVLPFLRGLWLWLWVKSLSGAGQMAQLHHALDRSFRSNLITPRKVELRASIGQLLAKVLDGIKPIASSKNASSVERVVTIDRAAFAAVEVEASSASIGAFWETSTDRSGHYVLGEVRPGRYTMWAETSGYGCIVIP